MLRVLCIGFALALSGVGAEARELKVVSWNLGWHLSKAEAEKWIATCEQPFALNAAGNAYEPSSSGTPGWALDWDRDASIKPKWDFAALPPCNVYQAYYDGAYKTVPVSAAAYENRVRQISDFISKELNADIFAFEEVSGEQAVREVLPGEGKDFNVCSFTGYKVQRIAFAWRKSLGEKVRCEPEAALSTGVPEMAAADRVRPGLTLELNFDGRSTKFLAVHLKSSCVSPLDGERGRLEKDDLKEEDSACETLQKQLRRLEAWVEREAPADGRIVVLGDFNRSLWYENQSSAPVRTDGSDPADDLPDSVRVANLYREVFDGKPKATDLILLDEDCPINQSSAEICKDRSTVVDATKRKTAKKTLAMKENLGCRNPMELDHILVGSGLVSNSAQKVALGVLGRTLPASSARVEALLSISDHCPLLASIGF